MADSAADAVTAQTMFNQAFQYDSNPLLLARGNKAVSGSLSSPELLVTGDMPTEHFDLDARLDGNEYDLPGYSSLDTHNKARFTEIGETWQATIAGTFDYDTTRTSEVLASGINTAGIRHTGIGLQPQFQVNLSPLDILQVSPSYTRNLYADTRLYNDYDYAGIAPLWQHALTDLDTLQLGGQLGRYQARSGPSITIDNAGPSLGLGRRFSERLSVSVNAGAQEMWFHYGLPLGLPDARTLGYTYSVTTTYQGQQDSLQLVAGRQPTPNANGSENETTTVNATAVHFVTTMLETDLTAIFQHFDYTGVQASRKAGLQREFISLAPKILYHLTQALSVDLTYQYREKDVIAGETGVSNVILMNFTYHPLAFSMR